MILQLDMTSDADLHEFTRDQARPRSTALIRSGDNSDSPRALRTAFNAWVVNATSGDSTLRSMGSRPALAHASRALSQISTALVCHPGRLRFGVLRQSS